MKTAWVRMVLLFCVFITMSASGCKNDNGGSSDYIAPINLYNLDFLGGTKHDDADRPDSTGGIGSPIITDTNYYPITRQGGLLTGVLTFDDDDFSGVTTLILQVEGASEFFTFDVIPLEDPLSPGTTTVNFALTLDPNFQPGMFTMYIGLMDDDGNISEYLGRLLVVKSIADLDIAEIIPDDGAVNVAVNTRIQANFSQQIYDGEATITLLQDGTPVPGQIKLSSNGRKLLFSPDDFLIPGEQYDATVTILVNGNSLSSRFTTANPPPLGTPANLDNMVFGTQLAEENLIEPEEGKMVFDLIVAILPPIANKILNLDVGAGTMLTVGGLVVPDGGGGWVQSSMIPAYGPDPGELMNPWFSWGPSEFVLSLAPLGVQGNIGIHDLIISGHFIEDGAGVITGFERGALTGRIDSREINVVLEALMHNKVDLCVLIPMCDVDGFVPLRLEELSGFSITGIDYLYGITCDGDVNPINAAAGGAINVTCTTTRNGAGFQGNDITFSAITSITGSPQAVGTWNNLAAVCSGTPPTCQVPPSGQVTVQLSIAPGELTSGDLTFNIGGSYNSPPGAMATVKNIGVE